MSELEILDPQKTALIGRGYGLDAVGARPEVNLPRRDVEPDMGYRMRLLAKLRWLNGEPISLPTQGINTYMELCEALNKQEPYDIDGLPYLIRHVEINMPHADGWMEAIPAMQIDGVWCGRLYGTETTAPADEPKPDHVRDAVLANQ